MHTNPISLKYIMKRLGLVKSNEHRPLMLPVSPELEIRLDEVLKGAGLLRWLKMEFTNRPAHLAGSL